MDIEREKLDLESLPEYIREDETSQKEARTAMPAKSQDRAPRVSPAEAVKPVENAFNFSSAIESNIDSVPSSTPKAHTDVLETLWPGVHHEFTQPPTRRTPSFYLTIGFMAGAVVSMLVVWTYSATTSFIASSQSNQDKQIVVAQGKGGNKSDRADDASSPSANGDAILPLVGVYEVSDGDTLAAIAIKNYKHVSPRLLDEICKANGMRNANVLSLGQKLNLPEYHRNASQVAAAGNGTPQ